MSATILLAEDDAKITDLVGRYLAADKFNFICAEDGVHAIEYFKKYHPDLVILDVLLPRIKGTLVCEKIREVSEVPIIMLTALSEENDLLAGFAKGADDYIAKPFNPRELMARIHALLRRAENKNACTRLEYKTISLNTAERTVTCDGNLIPLTQMEFNLLFLFLSNPKKVFTREELQNKSHSSSTESQARAIDFHIKNLRRKINAIRASQYIKAVYGVGFKLE